MKAFVTLLLAASLCLGTILPAAAQDQAPDPGQAEGPAPAPDNTPPPLINLPPKDPVLFPPGTFDPDALMSRLCHKVLAQLTCKPEGLFNFIKETNGVYLFNAFYGSTTRDFYCQVVPRERILVSSTAWGSSRYTVPFTVDDKNRCAEAHIGLSMCDRSATIRVCE
jgi:hypothetical protein